MDREKTTNIIIRIDDTTKQEFNKLCQKKAINSSALIRNMIKDWIKEQYEIEDHKRHNDV